MNARDVAGAWITAQINGDLDGALAALHDDLTWTIRGTTRFSGSRTKPEMIRLIIEELAPVMSGTLVAGDIIAEGDRAVLLASMQGKGPTGPYNQDYCFVMRVADDKIIEMLEYCDTAMIETAVCGRRLVSAA